jgi:hypothetical protein
MHSRLSAGIVSHLGPNSWLESAFPAFVRKAAEMLPRKAEIPSLGTSRLDLCRDSG